VRAGVLSVCPSKHRLAVLSASPDRMRGTMNLWGDGFDPLGQHMLRARADRA
jgi:hypothetical protein